MSIWKLEASESAIGSYNKSLNLLSPSTLVNVYLTLENTASSPLSSEVAISY